MPKKTFYTENEPFPADDSHPEGMLEIEGDPLNRYAARFESGITFAVRETGDLKLDLIRPNSQNEKHPLLVYIQGSAWYEQDAHLNLPQLADFAHQGYVVALVRYRPSTAAIFPAQLEDMKAAIEFLQQNAETYHIDRDKIAVWGDSSGGHLASLVGVTEEEDHRIKAVVNFYGPSDLTIMGDYPSVIKHYASDSAESTLIGGAILEMKKEAEKANPITYIRPDRSLPPFLIFHGDKDPIVPFNQSVRLYEALKESKKEVTFYKVKGAGHGDGVWTEEILKIVSDFLKEALLTDKK